ncbi:MAG: hypothetical protein HYT08_02770 [Candidatus Levybacteria bacterium]|nr:hypothetical protein [Candidatus Levybacteria bacterium]
MKQRDILLILIPTLFLVVLWVIFNIYHNSVNSTVSKNIAAEVVPIDPDFDFQTIENLKKRDIIQPVYELSPVTTPSSPINVINQATSSATEEPANITAPIEIPIETESEPSQDITSP